MFYSDALRFSCLMFRPPLAVHQNASTHQKLPTYEGGVSQKLYIYLERSKKREMPVNYLPGACTESREALPMVC